MSLMEANIFGGQSAHSMAQVYPKNSEVAERVTRLWKSLEFTTSAEFARFLRVDPRRINNVEAGLPLGKDLAFKMRQAIPGLTTDWLWYGEARGLSLDLAEKLGETERRRSVNTRS